MQMWDALLSYTKELFGLDVVSGDLPEGVQHANRVQFIGAGVGWVEATRTAIVNVTGETALGLVTDDVPGLVNEFPAGVVRLCSSDGATDGGQWDVCTLGMLNQALADHSVALAKLDTTGATAGQIPRLNPATGNYEPSDETAHVTYSAGAGMTASGTTFNVIAGDASLLVNADELHIQYAATVPLAPGTASAGTDAHAARIDHRHPSQSVPSASSAIPLVESGTGAAGSASPYSREDHVHPAIAASSNIFLPVTCVVRGIPIGSALGTPHHALYATARFFNFTNDAYQGIWVSNGPMNPASRAPDCDAGATFDLSKPTIIPVNNIHETGSDAGFVVCTTLTGTWTVGSNPAYSFSLVGADSTIPDGYDVIDHTDCFCASTRDVPDLTDFVNDGSLFDGFVLGDGQRVLLAKQTTDITTCGIYEVGHGEYWHLSRAGDLPADAVLSTTSVHRVTVLYGNLWGSPTRWAFWGNPSVVGATVPGGGVFSLLNLDGRDVFNGTVSASGAATSLFDAALSGETRAELRVVGKVTIDPAAYTTHCETTYIWTRWKDTPFEHDPGSSPYEDEDGTVWTLRTFAGDSSAVTRQSSQHHEGSYSWLVTASSDIYTSGKAAITLGLTPGYRYRVRVWARPGTGATASLRLSDSPYVWGTNLDYANTANTWELLDSGEFDVAVGDVGTLQLGSYDTVVGTTTSYVYFDGLIIDRIPIYVEPLNNVDIDVQATELGEAWDHSTVGWEGHVALTIADGTVEATPCEYPRTMRLACYTRKYSIQDDTTVSFTPPADDLTNPYE
jgi:hypothetical protein